MYVPYGMVRALYEEKRLDTRQMATALSRQTGKPVSRRWIFKHLTAALRGSR